MTVRAMWISLTLAVAGLTVRLLGYDLTWPFVVVPAALAGAAVLIDGWLANPSLQRLVRTYDRHFQLGEVLGTGLEVAAQTPDHEQAHGQIEQRLVEQALLATYALRRRVAARPLLPLRDVEMLLAVALIGVGTLIASRWSTLPDVAPMAIQPLPTPAPSAPTQSPKATTQPASTGDQPAPGLSPEDKAAADAIADGLRDNGATRPAADALDRGATGDAASQLRELAGQASQLSPEARSDIAQGLRGAADRLRANQPDRARRLEQTADAVAGDGQQATKGLEDLANLVDELGRKDQTTQNSGQNGDNQSADGQTPGQPSPGDGAGANGPNGGGGAGNGLGGESRGGQTTPPAASGDLMPLPPAPDTGGQRTTATGPQGPTVQLDAGGTRASGAGSATGSTGGSDSPLSGEADPLRIPPEYRDVVEKYFSPAR